MPVIPTVTAAAVDGTDGIAAAAGASDSGQRKECVTVDEITMNRLRKERRSKIGGKSRARGQEKVCWSEFSKLHASCKGSNIQPTSASPKYLMVLTNNVSTERRSLLSRGRTVSATAGMQGLNSICRHGFNSRMLKERRERV